VGLEPACVKTCPTGAISFGTKVDMKTYAEKRAGELRERGFKGAGVYDPDGVKGTHVMYVLKHADMPALVGLPEHPQVSPLVSLWKGITKPLAGIGLGLVALGAFLHYVTVGPHEVPEDEDERESTH
jgi:formate dehydrogenase iron-sulfur subunit